MNLEKGRMAIVMFTWAIVFLVIAVILFLLFGLSLKESEDEISKILFFFGLVFIVAGSITLYNTALGRPANGYYSTEKNVVYRAEVVSKPTNNIVKVVLSKPDGSWRLSNIQEKVAEGMTAGNYYYTTGGYANSWRLERFNPLDAPNLR